MASWYKDNGDSVLNLDFPIKKNSVVLDIGVFKGKWTYDMSTRYKCNIFSFEPVRSFYDEASRLLKDHKNVKLFNYGVWIKNTNMPIGVRGCSSSIYLEEKKETCEFKDISEIFKMVGQVDVMAINAEGSEYDLVEAMIKRGLISRVRFLNAQFHINNNIIRINGGTLENVYKRYERINKELSVTHLLRWRYPFTWESWIRKD
jgi:FkbM family methyltransferase